MTSVAVIVPLQTGCPHREAAWEFIQSRLRDRHPEWQIIEAETHTDPFCKADAVMPAVHRSDADVLVIHDADMWTDGLEQCVIETSLYGWAVPHRHVSRLSPDATLRVYESRQFDQPELQEHHKAVMGGAIFTITRDLLISIPFDPRFRGWGGEDISLGHALRTLHGRAWQGSYEMYHLWHPPQPRLNRAVGNLDNQALTLRYLRASRRPDQMRVIVDEARAEVSALC